MEIELKYFTGTGNSLKIANVCKQVFEENKHEVNISAISQGNNSIRKADLIGFCFPVYAFGIPRICRNYLKKIPRFYKEQKVFILITAGNADESGFSIKECGHILSKKNCKIIYSDVIEMPINWTTSPIPPFPPTKEEAAEIIQIGVSHAKVIVENILNKNFKLHVLNFPKRYSKLKFYWEYWSFKYIGIYNLWRLFKVYDSCNGCELCSKICPTKSITIVNKKPVWHSTCEQCMRCVNYCPKEAIYQAYGYDTKGKNHYHEPGFKPLKEMLNE